MNVNEANATTPEDVVSQQVTVDRPSMIAIILPWVLLTAVLTGLVGYYLGARQGAEIVTTESSSPPLTEKVSEEVEGELEADDWQSQAIDGLHFPDEDNFFGDFTIFYPENWQIEINSDHPNYRVLVELTSDKGEQIIFRQGEFHWHECWYGPEEMPEGMTIYYPEYIDLMNWHEGRTWRISKNDYVMEDGTTHAVCTIDHRMQFRDETSWWAATRAGTIAIRTVDGEVSDEIIEILQRIE